MKSVENPPNSAAGLSLEEKKQFILPALKVMAQHTFPYICSVIGIAGPKIGRHYGSALRCKLNGRRAILTALHVLEMAKNESRGLAISTRYGMPPFAVHGNVNIDTLADLAVYFLPNDYPCPEDAFWPAARIDHTVDKLDTDYLFIHGFPGASSYPSRLLEGGGSKSLPYGAMRCLDHLPPDLQQYEFAVDYDPVAMVGETGAAQDMVAPYGLSGGPVWRIGVSGRSLKTWTANDSLLVGILTKWRPDEKVLIATSAEKILKDW